MNKPMSVDEEIHEFNEDQIKNWHHDSWITRFERSINKASEEMLKWLRENTPAFTRRWSNTQNP